MKKPITQWSKNDRPREKLLSNGKESLSDSELIAILIGSGNRKLSAVELAKLILADHNDKLNSLGRADIYDLMKYSGIGEAKAITILAAMELGRRRKSEAAEEIDKITCSRDLFNYLNPIMGDLNHEVFYLLLLNRANQIIKKMKISSGGVSATVMDARLVFKPAVNHMASAIVIAHNHPSGNLKPSHQDIAVTKKIQAAGNVLDIKLLDHIIVTQQGYYSFSDEGHL